AVPISRSSDQKPQSCILQRPIGSKGRVAPCVRHSRPKEAGESAMKRLMALAVAAGVVWAAGCKSTTTQTSGGAIERTPVAETKPESPAKQASEVQPAAATETKRDGVVPAFLLSPATGGACSH